MSRDLAHCISDMIRPLDYYSLNAINALLTSEDHLAEPLSKAIVVDCNILECPFNTAYGKTRVVEDKVYMTQLCSHPVLLKIYSKE